MLKMIAYIKFVVSGLILRPDTIEGELCKKFYFWPYEQVVYAQPGICPRKWDTQSSLGFWDIDASADLSQMTRSGDSQQKKKNGETPK